MRKILTGIFVFGFTIFTSAFAFSDVSNDFWAYDKIEQMYKSGIINGFEDGTFRPNATITREQCAAILTNFFELDEKEVRPFEDVPSGYWSEIYNNSVSEYMPIDEIDGKYYFRPQDAAKRAEIAETVSKIIGLVAEDTDLEIINNFNDKDTFLEKDKKYIALVAKNGIMVGDDKSNFRPNDTLTRAEFCALIYNIYLVKDDLKNTVNNKKLEETVITINGEKVSVGEFNTYFTLRKKLYEALLGGSGIWTQEIEGTTVYEIVKEETKDDIIFEKIKVQNANKLGIELSDEVKNEAMNYVNSDEGIEICEFYGITPEQLYKMNCDGELIHQLTRVMYERADHTNHEHIDINESFETIIYDARHILLSTENLPEEAKANIKEIANEVLAKVLNGEDFATLANEYSDDPGSNQNGGLYENIELGQFVKEFEDAVLMINEGMIYPELVESSYGYHIIKLEKKTQVTKELTDEEKQEIMNADLESFVEEWLNNSVIELNEEAYYEI